MRLFFLLLTPHFQNFRLTELNDPGTNPFEVGESIKAKEGRKINATFILNDNRN